MDLHNSTQNRLPYTIWFGMKARQGKARKTTTTRISIIFERKFIPFSFCSSLSSSFFRLKCFFIRFVFSFCIFNLFQMQIMNIESMQNDSVFFNIGWMLHLISMDYELIWLVSLRILCVGQSICKAFSWKKLNSLYFYLKVDGSLEGNWGFDYYFILIIRIQGFCLMNVT